MSTEVLQNWPGEIDNSVSWFVTECQSKLTCLNTKESIEAIVIEWFSNH